MQRHRSLRIGGFRSGWHFELARVHRTDHASYHCSGVDNYRAAVIGPDCGTGRLRANDCSGDANPVRRADHDTNRDADHHPDHQHR